MTQSETLRAWRVVAIVAIVANRLSWLSQLSFNVTRATTIQNTTSTQLYACFPAIETAFRCGIDRQCTTA